MTTSAHGLRVGFDGLGPDEDQFFQAGQRVPPGVYWQLEGRREVRLDQEDILPASLDGHVAVYVRRPMVWSERPRLTG